MAFWAAIKEYLEQTKEENHVWKSDEDHCIDFLLAASNRIVEEEKPQLIKTSHANFAQALMKTGLQYLKGQHDHVPCVKAFKAIFDGGKYSKQFEEWIFKVMTLEEERTIGGLSWGLDEEHDEL